MQRPEPANPTAGARSVRSPIDAVSLLSLFLGLLVAVPVGLVIAPLGAVGAPAAVVGYACFAWWVLAFLSSRLGLPSGRQPVRVAMVVFCVTILASYAAGAIRPLFADELSGADRSIITMVGWAGVALLTADGVRSEERLERLLRRLVLFAAFVATLGIMQFFFELDVARWLHLPGLEANQELAVIQKRSDFRRVSGTASHPIEFGVVLATAFPLALHFATNHGKRPLDRHRIQLGLITFGILVSVSRSAILGLACASLVMFLGWDTRRRINALVLTPILLVATRFVVPGLLGTIRSLYTNLFDDPSVKGRTDDYAMVGDFITGNPVFGRGFGTFSSTRYFYLDNQYLAQVVETGLLGVTALVAIFVAAIACARSVRRRSRSESDRDLAQALTAAVVVPMVTFVTFDGFGFALVCGYMFVVIGCCGALYRLSRAWPTPPARPIRPRLRVVDA